MAIRGPRLEFAVGAFLVLALASLLVLAFASTNRQFGFGGGSYPLVARFANLGQLRLQAPVKIGGVVVGRVEKIDLDPVKFDSVVTLAINDRYKDLPADTSAGILTSGLLGESFIGLQPGGDPEPLQPGDEIAYTQPAIDLIQLVGKYMFGGAGAGAPPPPTSQDPSPTEATPQ
ncbi:outer membrane lipid asymmetry maintenance protein MlaD [Pseudoxanthomonas daejeonensis]|uniref:Outer membrane lipid asymmetry maintenance protein MlaD n=1 Tax=Pseudoxanthomonas daejeonensis TaxID=266062 RepID=A0ABQ6Z6H2_9GAMM|nr:outer membrane lipid asymmetry maintenance protein MlaD [Pseudoxanthomonas daejeonensis]KAF1694332.1 outer membrane lipid asymmetry maintenance protein MlaD [Pseudoxanthomonas daejeonensis]UNK58793.1 outer membrane lipid asymmetry maintenance protein MlaD [Pseudoxanthomonas daejeonensis]